MSNILKKIALAAYMAIDRFLPIRPLPGFRLSYLVRRTLAMCIFEQCGRGVTLKRMVRFGTGEGIRIGENSLIEYNCYLSAGTVIGRDVTVGPEVVIWTYTHDFDSVDKPINTQGQKGPCPVEIGDDVWIGQRVMILPGVRVGSHSVVGCGAVITRDVPEWAVVAGVPAKVIRMRK